LRHRAALVRYPLFFYPQLYPQDKWRPYRVNRDALSPPGCNERSKLLCEIHPGACLLLYGTTVEGQQWSETHLLYSRKSTSRSPMVVGRMFSDAPPRRPRHYKGYWSVSPTASAAISSAARRPALHPTPRARRPLAPPASRTRPMSSPHSATAALFHGAAAMTLGCGFSLASVSCPFRLKRSPLAPQHIRPYERRPGFNTESSVRAYFRYPLCSAYPRTMTCFLKWVPKWVPVFAYLLVPSRTVGVGR